MGVPRVLWTFIATFGYTNSHFPRERIEIVYVGPNTSSTLSGVYCHQTTNIISRYANAVTALPICCSSVDFLLLHKEGSSDFAL